MSLRLSLFLLFLSWVTSLSLAGDPSAAVTDELDEQLEGHSYHGEVFDEGPRQAASLIPGTGQVSFPATCATEEVQQFIDQGVGQLHGFWYLESERSFRQAAALDPECAIAYWGMAMSNRENRKRGRGFIVEAVKRKENASEREKMLIEALAHFFGVDPNQPTDEVPSEADSESSETTDEKKENDSEQKDKDKEADKIRRQTLLKDYEDILHKYPDDIEVKALLCLALYENRTKGVPISSYYAVDALLKTILEENPLHPCHHYVIHLWDSQKPERALASAALCGESAPAIAHMWHMPGHTYSKLKRYHDAAWQQEASARTDHAQMMRTQLLPDQIHNFAHNNEWLVRNLIFIGRASDAVDLAKNMIDLPRHPKYNVFNKSGSAKFGRTRLMQTLQAFQLWDQVLELQETIYLEPTDLPEEQRKRDVLIGVAKFQTGDVAGGKEILERWASKLAEVEQKRDKAGKSAANKAGKSGKAEKDQTKVADTAKRKFATEIRSLESAVNELTGHLHLAEGEFDKAFNCLKKVSNFDKGWLAWIELQAGREKEAVAAIKKHVAATPGEVIPRAWQVRVLWDADQQAEAKEAFDTLLELSSAIDLNAPVFAPINEIAEQLGFGEDWRQPYEFPADFGKRPDLASLGPFRWSPTPAPEFGLPDQHQKSVSLKDFRGRPVIVIFYLGYGCLHCAEQLQAFAPLTEQFSEAGISLLAISSDNVEELALSHENYGKEDFPFPLVSDAALNIFKKYRCYDDFEQQPLHGTFLIDEQGQVRWHDIGYEPFMDAEFVLKESQRLLHQKPSELQTAKAGSEN